MIEPEFIQEGKQRIIPYSEGQKFYIDHNFSITYDYKILFTYNPPDRRVSSCNGDSGSGLFIRNSNDELECCGIVSFGSIDCTDGSPSVYTDAGAYRDFIENGVGAMPIYDFNAQYDNTVQARAIKLPPEENDIAKQIWEIAERSEHDDDGMIAHERSIFDIIFPQQTTTPAPHSEAAFCRIMWNFVSVMLGTYKSAIRFLGIT